MVDQITEIDYYSVDPIFRVIVHGDPRKFGTVLLPGQSRRVVLCWRSDLVQPMTVFDPQTSTVWIGVDQRVVAIGAEGNVVFSIGLNSNFVQVLPLRQCAVVLCETQAVAVNSDYSLRRILDLPDIPDAARSQDNKLAVTFVDGRTEVYTL
jgi:hypothetical protein